MSVHLSFRLHLRAPSPVSLLSTVSIPLDGQLNTCFFRGGVAPELAALTPPDAFRTPRGVRFVAALMESHSDLDSE